MDELEKARLLCVLQTEKLNIIRKLTDCATTLELDNIIDNDLSNLRKRLFTDVLVSDTVGV